MDTTASIETVTPEMAIRWMSENLYEHQRPPSDFHVKFLADEMLRHTFKQDTVIEFCQVNGTEVLTDGQHRLKAVVLSGKPQRFVVVKRAAKSEKDIAADYTRTDKGRARTVADDYKVLLLEEELGLTATQVNKFGSAVAHIHNEFGSVRSLHNKLHTDDRLRLMREYNEAYGMYLEATVGVSKDMRKKLERSATVSVALVTFRYSSALYGDKVEDFWNGIARDDGLRANDARKTAIKHLLISGMPGGAGGNSERTVSAAYSSRYLASCFNAFVSNKELSHAKVMDAYKPILILGSPFNGK